MLNNQTNFKTLVSYNGLENYLSPINSNHSCKINRLLRTGCIWLTEIFTKNFSLMSLTRFSLVSTDGRTVSMRVASLPKIKRLLPDLRVFVRGLCEMWILYFADFYG